MSGWNYDNNPRVAHIFTSILPPLLRCQLMARPSRGHIEDNQGLSASKIKATSDNQGLSVTKINTSLANSKWKLWPHRSLCDSVVGLYLLIPALHIACVSPCMITPCHITASHAKSQSRCYWSKYGGGKLFLWRWHMCRLTVVTLCLSSSIAWCLDGSVIK